MFTFQLPFYFTPLKECNANHDLPLVLPFHLYANNELGLIQQKSNSETSRYLKKAYEIGSLLSGSSVEGTVFQDYYKEFFKFVEKNIQGPISGKRVLEIGCGNAQLLKEFKLKGASVLGIEPGPHAITASEKLNIEIINGFFPNERIKGTFDVIILNSVFEHLDNLESIIDSIKNVCNRESSLMISVPNDFPYTSTGDTSSLIHEHYTYFTIDSMRDFLDKRIGQIVDISTSSNSSMIYSAVNIKQTTEKNQLEKNDIEKTLLVFYQKYLQNKKNFIAMFNANRNKKIAIYCPGRFINMFTAIQSEIETNNILFFDDDNLLKNKYFPSIGIPVLDFNDYQRIKPDITYIMSSTFKSKFT